jgi:hypothetical protein
MNDAVAGLLGVALGGGITFGAQWFFESRRERSEVRAGLQLVRRDLLDALGAVRRAHAAETWPEGTNKDWLGTWRDYRPVLARRLSADDFDAASAAYARMDELQSGLNTGRSDQDRSMKPIDGEDDEVSTRKTNDVEFLDQMQELLDPAVEAVEKAAATEASARWLWRSSLTRGGH